MSSLTIVPTNALAFLASKVSDAELRQNLLDDAHSSRNTLAPASERALRGDVLAFSRWCADNGRRDLPASAETLADFIDDMSKAGKAPATVARFVSSVSTFHRSARAENPAEAKMVTDALRRMRRERQVKQRQAAPITDDVAVRMLEPDVAGSTLGNLRNKALLATAYCTLARRGELVGMLVEDLETDREGWGVIAIRSSKTDQEGAGAVVGISPDAMTHVTRWIAAAGITNGKLFRSVDKDGRVGAALEAGTVARIFRAMAAKAGVSAKAGSAFSGHSTRVGGAIDLISYGADMAGAMQVGRWKSTSMLARYTAGANARLGAAAKVAAARKKFA
jgi:site-specific recombinase XerD